ncbi:MAG TPA: phytanoyl-CoA dioxygenase family protein [Abditibacteriaceae bacterium]|nr:phytanoyl-CoA dioxygenase family protein [Abditibacteriaceae bacterium]
MLTDKEKYLFDLHGFVVIKNAVPHDDIKRMLKLCDRWHSLPDAELPPPLVSYGSPSLNPTEARAIVNVDYGDEVFQRLALNPEIMRLVLALTLNSPQLLDIALTRNVQESNDIPFHGGVADYPQVPRGLHHPACAYQAVGETIFANFLNAAVPLVDVPQGTGFVCIPGSHKTPFARPHDIGLYDDPPTVVNVCPKAGDVVLFTEALVHGARKWTADYPRRTVFVRYSTSYASWSPGHGPLEEHKDKISDEIYELHQTLGFQGRKKVVQHLLTDMGEA